MRQFSFHFFCQSILFDIGLVGKFTSSYSHTDQIFEIKI